MKKYDRSLAILILSCAASGKGGETLEEIAHALDIEKGAPVTLARRMLGESVGAGTWREARAEAALKLQPYLERIKPGKQPEPRRPRSPNMGALRHGHTSKGKMSPTYRAWVNLRRTGPAVCARWSSFDAFLADVGAKPDGTRLKRDDRKRGYEPGNVTWASSDGAT